jgi:hypothetical protein
LPDAVADELPWNALSQVASPTFEMREGGRVEMRSVRSGRWLIMVMAGIANGLPEPAVVPAARVAAAPVDETQPTEVAVRSQAPGTDRG